MWMLYIFSFGKTFFQTKFFSDNIFSDKIFSGKEFWIKNLFVSIFLPILTKLCWPRISFAKIRWIDKKFKSNCFDKKKLTTLFFTNFLFFKNKIQIQINLFLNHVFGQNISIKKIWQKHFYHIFSSKMFQRKTCFVQIFSLLIFLLPNIIFEPNSIEWKLFDQDLFNKTVFNPDTFSSKSFKICFYQAPDELD